MVPNEGGKEEKKIKREDNSQPCETKREREVIYLLSMLLSVFLS